MNHKILLRLCNLLLSAIMICTAQAANKKDKTPAVLLRKASFYTLSGLERKTDATVLHLKFHSRWYYDPANKGTVYLKRAYLVQGTDTIHFTGGEVFNERTGEKRTLLADSIYLPVRFNTDNHEVPVFDRILMRFPALPNPKSPFTLVIERPQGKDIFAGIRTDGKNYKPLLKPQRIKPTERHISRPQAQNRHAVLTAKVIGWDFKNMDFSIHGNYESFTGDPWDFKYEWDLKEGTFRFDFDLLYPIHFQADIPSSLQYVYLIQPGDSIHADIDLYAHSAYISQGMDETEALLRCVHHSGKGINKVAEEWLRRKASWSYSNQAFHHDSCQAHITDDFTTFAEIKWQEHQNHIKEIENEKLSDDEREFLRLMSENIYLTGRNFGFLTTKRFAREVPDSATMAAFQAQINFHDPHAAELHLPHTLKSLYFVNNDKLYEYFKANSLLSTDMGKWTEHYHEAKKAHNRINLMQPIRTEEEWQAIDTLYRPLLRKENAKAEALLRQQAEKQSNLCSVEGTDASTYLSQILAAHAGHAVLIDLWATWCGPCMKGMKDMEAIKAEMGARGVDFVYITDESSPLAAWQEQTGLHAGNHYRISSTDMKAMHIPGYKGSIPHYVVYDRNGQYVTSFSGWGDESLEKVRTILGKALGQ